MSDHFSKLPFFFNQIITVETSRKPLRPLLEQRKYTLLFEALKSLRSRIAKHRINDDNRATIPCLGQTRVKLFTLFRTNWPKTIPCPAARPCIVVGTWCIGTNNVPTYILYHRLLNNRNMYAHQHWYIICPHTPHKGVPPPPRAYLPASDHLGFYFRWSLTVGSTVVLSDQQNDR